MHRLGAFAVPALVLLTMLVVVACDSKRPVDAGIPDQASPDTGPDLAAPRDAGPGDPGQDDRPYTRMSRLEFCTLPGYICTSQQDCCPGSFCVDPRTGVKVCLFDCGGAPCGSAGCHGLYLPPPDNKRQYCMNECTPAIGKNDCNPGLACHPASEALMPNNCAVCLHPACTTGKDCPVRLAAICAPQAPAPQCAGQPAGAFCAPDAPGSATGHCALPGKCDPVSGLCLPHDLGDPSATIGDPCVDDRDCGGAMYCEQEKVDASGNVHARNGYCSLEGCLFAAALPFRACPPGTACSRFWPGGRCLKTCDFADPTGCRNYPADKHGDYECYKWNVNSVPTCEPAVPCDYLKPNWLCSLVGDSTNSTDMACRDRTTGAKLPDQTPYGYCLDTTASGP